VRKDDTYDLHGLIFEFQKTDKEELYYHIEEQTKDEFCKPEEPKVEEPVEEPVVEEEQSFIHGNVDDSLYNEEVDLDKDGVISNVELLIWNMIRQFN